MEELGFYPLSSILSFLNETEGTSLLLTKQFYARQILPLFRLKTEPGLVVVNALRNRHRFRVSPVQDPTVLLARLNTRRLAKRKTQELQPQHGMSSEELAETECIRNRQSRDEDGNYSFLYPPSLELLRFLDSSSKLKPNNGGLPSFWSDKGMTLLVSYPRSGNTLLRTLLERITGVVTGSDTRPDRTLSKALAEAHNLVGEGICSNTKTWCVKTHWPERMGFRCFTGHQVILLVRNPFDAIDSYWNLNVTNTHTETVTDDIYARFHDLFDGLVKNEINVWLDFHSFWLEECKKNELPLLLMRFEDLIENTSAEMVRLFDFLTIIGTQRRRPANLTGHSLSPFWKQRIHHSTKATPKEHLGSYRPRTATTGVMSVGKSLRKGRYTPGILQFIHQAAATNTGPDGENLLRKFGYDIDEQSFPENFQQGCAPEITIPEFLMNESRGTTRVNKGATIRPRDCPFGRSMRSWRLKHTNNDTEPFPTVSRQA